MQEDPVDQVRGPSWLRRHGIVLVYVWAGLLCLQNIAIVGAVFDGLKTAYDSVAQDVLWAMLACALAKLFLLPVSGFWFLNRKSRPVVIFFAGSILYAFPFGPMLERVLLRMVFPGQEPVHFLGLIGVSALFSYASAAYLLLTNRDAPVAPSPDAPAETFD